MATVKWSQDAKSDLQKIVTTLATRMDEDKTILLISRLLYHLEDLAQHALSGQSIEGANPDYRQTTILDIYYVYYRLLGPNTIKILLITQI